MILKWEMYLVCSENILTICDPMKTDKEQLTNYVQVESYHGSVKHGVE